MNYPNLSYDIVKKIQKAVGTEGIFDNAETVVEGNVLLELLDAIQNDSAYTGFSESVQDAIECLSDELNGWGLKCNDSSDLFKTMEKWNVSIF